MIFLIALIAFIVFLNVCFIIAWITKNITAQDFPSMFNPKYLYEENDLDIVGTVILTILFNSIYFVFAIMYWFVAITQFLMLKGDD